MSSRFGEQASTWSLAIGCIVVCYNPRVHQLPCLIIRMTSQSDLPRQYSRSHAEKFRKELFEMLRIPSISADPNYAGEIRRMAEWLASHLGGLGLDNAQVMETAGHPVAYAEWLGGGGGKPA